MTTVMEWMRANWGWVLSFGTVRGGFLAYVTARIRALQLGVQALLRAQMISDFNRYQEKGFAPLYARENFENCYVQYKRLGGNWVMTDIHTKFLALPTHGGS